MIFIIFNISIIFIRLNKWKYSAAAYDESSHRDVFDDILVHSRAEIFVLENGEKFEKQK